MSDHHDDCSYTEHLDLEKKVSELEAEIANWRYLADKSDAEIDELEGQLNRQASSHGMYITQTLESKIFDLESQLRESTERVAQIAKESLEHQTRMQEYRAENTRLREALEYYADPESYEPRITFGGIRPPGVFASKGQKAREALEAAESALDPNVCEHGVNTLMSGHCNQCSKEATQDECLHWDMLSTDGILACIDCGSVRKDRRKESSNDEKA